MAKEGIRCQESIHGIEKSCRKCYDLYIMDSTDAFAPEISLHTLAMGSPFIAASGTLGWGESLRDVPPESLPGAFVTPTLTLEARAGNAMPRTAEITAGLLYATGLPNPGIAEFLSEKLPLLVRLDCPLIVSIWGETLADWQSLARELSSIDETAALELNLLPPKFIDAEANPQSDEIQTLFSRTLEAIAAVRSVWKGTLIAKLPSIGLDISVLAWEAENHGADVLDLSQGFPGYAVKAGNGKPRLANAVGIVSGPCIKPLALYQVYEAAQAVTCPIIGGGGIMNGEDAREFLAAGATAVSIGTATLIHPSTLGKLTAELRASSQVAKA